jgi:TRAP-type C4-dicarboxylate transport system permease small subunit
MRHMLAFHRLAKLLSDALFAIALFAGFLMMMHVSADVIARTVFNSPLPGTGEITATYYMIAGAFLPWAYVTYTNGHITADLFTKGLSDHASRWLDLFVDLLTTIYVALFCWQAFISAERKMASVEVWEIPGGYLPVWPTRWILPVAGAAMILTLVFRIAARLARREDLLPPRI